MKVNAFLKRCRDGTEGRKKLSDGNGLYITLTAAGSAVWRIKYRYDGKERLYSVGVYPEITLERARAEREVVRASLRKGTDPVQDRQLKRAENAVASVATFAGATEQWLAKKKGEWSSIHYLKTSQALERDVLPLLGKLPTSGITTPMVARVIEKIVRRGANETAGKILWSIRGIFELAQVQDGSAIRENPAIAARAVLGEKKSRVPHAALLAFGELGDLLRRTELAALTPQVRLALRLVAYTACRIGNAVEAQWKEFDLDGDTPSWTVPRALMKTKDRSRHDHRVLLCSPIAGELRLWKAVTGGRGFLFSSPHSKQPHISREALEKVYRVTLGMRGRHSVHGWRASFSTLAREQGFERDAVELTLDHIHDTEVVRAYDRGARLATRTKLMKWWGDQLERAQSGVQVLSIRTPEVA